MRISGVFMALGLAAMASSAAAQVRTDPAWLLKPTLQEIWDYYPKLATMFEISGQVVVACRVEANSILTDCAIDSESPKGFGFAEAATAVAYSHMKVRPAMIDGRPDPATVVTIPITFTARPQPSLSRPVAPPQPKADVAALAERAARGDEIFLYLQRLVAGLLGDLEGGGAEVSPAVAEAFRAAGREEVRTREAALRGLIVAYYAQAVGEAKLRGLAVTGAGTGGQAGPLRASLSDPELEPLLRLIAYELDDVTNDAKAKVCAKLDCGRAAAD